MLPIDPPTTPPPLVAFAPVRPADPRTAIFQQHLDGTRAQPPASEGTPAPSVSTGASPEDGAAEIALLLAGAGVAGASLANRRGRGDDVAGQPEATPLFQEITDPAELSRIVGAGPAQGPFAASGVPRPIPASPESRAIGALSEALGANVNPALRRIIADIRSDAAPIAPFDAASGEAATARAEQALREAGAGLAAESAAPNLVTLARAMNVDVGALASRLASTLAEADENVARHGPGQPILVDSRLDPGSLDRAVRYFTDALSQGVRVPALTRDVAADDTVYAVQETPKLKPTASMQDIDGVSAKSYGTRGLDVAIVTQSGERQHLHLPLTAPLPDAPRAISGVMLHSIGQSAVVQLEGRGAEAGRPVASQWMIPISRPAYAALSGTASTEPRAVEGLAARFFPPESVDFIQQVSANTIRGAIAPGLLPNPIVGNTFGTIGEQAFEGSPAKLVTSFARSLPASATTEPLPPGLFAAPGWKVYSGGSAITQTSEGRIGEPFGLSAEQAQGLRNVAAALPPLVDELARSYGLSERARSDFQDALFADVPDIPSVILPAQVVAELKDRTAVTRPGQTLSDLQQEIDQRLLELQDRNGLGDIITLHHTPTGVTPDNPDTVARHAPGTREAFTTEWQFAVNGQKALPVLDNLVQDLKDNHGIDLKGELEAAGHGYGDIRRLSLPETIGFFRDVVRPMVDAHGPGLTGKVIVAADTIYGRGSGIGGSDASMVNALKALYGAQNTVLVQVDTFAGQTPREPGRNPAFQLTADRETGALHVSVPSIDPHGPAGDVAPTAYVTTQSEFGTIFSRALRNQSLLTPDELRVQS